MKQVLSRVFLGLSMGIISVAQAGLFDSLADSVKNIGGSPSRNAPIPEDKGNELPPPDLATFKPVLPAVKAENLDALGKKKSF